MMDLVDKIIKLYSSLTYEDFSYVNGTIRLRNDSDGRGDYIASWRHPDYPQPTEEQLAGIE